MYSNFNCAYICVFCSKIVENEISNLHIEAAFWLLFKSPIISKLNFENFDISFINFDTTCYFLVQLSQRNLIHQWLYNQLAFIYKYQFKMYFFINNFLKWNRNWIHWLLYYDNISSCSALFNQISQENRNVENDLYCIVKYFYVDLANNDC